VGVREKRRKRKRTEEAERPSKTQSTETLPPVEERPDLMTESHAPEVIIETSAEAAVEEPLTTVEEPHAVVEETHATAVEMPPWGDIAESEWMYGVPDRESDRQLWAEEWGDYLLQWSQHRLVHVLSVSTFISEPPFKDMKNKVDAFRVIAQGLIEKEVAEWTDKKQRQLRIYWRPLEEWADMIYEWCLATGRLRLDVKSIIIQYANQDFAKLPEKDLYRVLALMVDKGYAEWVDKKKGAVTVDI